MAALIDNLYNRFPGALPPAYDIIQFRRLRGSLAGMRDEIRGQPEQEEWHGRFQERLEQTVRDNQPLDGLLAEFNQKRRELLEAAVRRRLLEELRRLGIDPERVPLQVIEGVIARHVEEGARFMDHLAPEDEEALRRGLQEQLEVERGEAEIRAAREQRALRRDRQVRQAEEMDQFQQEMAARVQEEAARHIQAMDVRARDIDIHLDRVRVRIGENEERQRQLVAQFHANLQALVVEGRQEEERLQLLEAQVPELDRRIGEQEVRTSQLKTEVANLHQAITDRETAKDESLFKVVVMVMAFVMINELLPGSGAPLLAGGSSTTAVGTAGVGAAGAGAATVTAPTFGLMLPPNGAMGGMIGAKFPVAFY